MGVNVSNDAYTDTGTGAYPNPPAEVTYTAPGDGEPTGTVDGPPSKVTYTSEEYGEPTGDHANPPAEVTYEPYSHMTKAVADVPAEVVEAKAEDKQVAKASAARKRAARKGK